MKHNADVEIYGQRYRIKGEADPEYIRTLSKYVNEKMREVSSHTGENNSLRVAILAAINISHELLSQKKSHKEKETTINQKAKDIIDMIEEQFEDLRF